MKNRTKGPWQIRHGYSMDIVDCDGEVRGCSMIATTAVSPGSLTAAHRAEAIDNAAYIVHCVNTHEQLLATLRRTHSLLFLRTDTGDKAAMDCLREGLLTIAKSKIPDDHGYGRPAPDPVK